MYSCFVFFLLVEIYFLSFECSELEGKFILSSFLCFVSGGCCLYVACGDTMLFVYVTFMGGLVQSCWVFLVNILSSSHSLGDFDA